MCGQARGWKLQENDLSTLRRCCLSRTDVRQGWPVAVRRLRSAASERRRGRSALAQILQDGAWQPGAAPIAAARGAARVARAIPVRGTAARAKERARR